MRAVRRGGLGLFAAAAVVLAVQPAALASTAPAPTWTKQAPATHPPARLDGSMAYDAATGTVVLFGGNGRGVFDGTWTWDGSTWTKQAPATHPPVRSDGSMAYDAATGTVVLFGGEGRDGGRLSGTWTWDGSTWTKQAPATHPPARDLAAMAYDAATGTVVLFGGVGTGGYQNGTWAWDGSTWTKQAPATHPPARYSGSMAYDAATGTIVLFGGYTTQGHGGLNDTWTWDGSTWTKQAPATHPPAECGRVDGLRRGHRHRRLVRRPRQTATSMAPGPGTARPGPSRRPRPARPPGRAGRWPTTRPPAPSSCSAASNLAKALQWHLDLGRLELDEASTSSPPDQAGGRGDGLRRGH